MLASAGTTNLSMIHDGALKLCDDEMRLRTAILHAVYIARARFAIWSEKRETRNPGKLYIKDKRQKSQI